MYRTDDKIKYDAVNEFVVGLYGDDVAGKIERYIKSLSDQEKVEQFIDSEKYRYINSSAGLISALTSATDSSEIADILKSMDTADL